ncbi:hypothetical protein HY631_04640 [Candidatus Uhrbacteria bacterium]|nr:hypothetical protein [Candidatus Uhrbacteria bacterium]
MTTTPLDERVALYKTLFGNMHAMRLAQATVRELQRDLAEGSGAVLADMTDGQRDRLRAILRLCQLYYPEFPSNPVRATCLGDVLRYLADRFRVQTERVVWMLALREHDVIEDEVLVQLGGHATAPPPVKAMLRHAIKHAAVAAYIVDFRPTDSLVLGDDVVTAMASLVQLSAVADIEFRDYVLVNRGEVISVREAITERGEEKEAA